MKKIVFICLFVIFATLYAGTAYAQGFRHIPWSFNVYNDYGEHVATFSSQYVYVLNEYDDGWILINTGYGNLWVNIDDVPALYGRTIILDPGHGAGADNVFMGYSEGNAMFALAEHLKPLLQAQGANVLLTRPDLYNVHLTLRAAYMNLWSLEAFAKCPYAMEAAYSIIMQSRRDIKELIYNRAFYVYCDGYCNYYFYDGYYYVYYEGYGYYRIYYIGYFRPDDFEYCLPTLNKPWDYDPPAIYCIFAELDRLKNAMRRIIYDFSTYAHVYFNFPFDSSRQRLIHPDLHHIFALQAHPSISSNFFAISLHSNATGRPINTRIHGADVYIMQNDNPNSQSYFASYTATEKTYAFADILLDKIDELGISRRAIKPGNFFIIRETNLPMALVENGFHTNPHDRSLLSNDAFLYRLAHAYVDALSQIFK